MFRRAATVFAALLTLTVGAQSALAVCGDDVCNFGEDCDSCPEDCCPSNAPPCGDSVCETGETCSSCHFDCCDTGACGDGLLDGGEECDDGNDIDGDGCSASCMFEATLICGSPSNTQHAVWLRASDVTGPTVTFWNNYARRFDFSQSPDTSQPTIVASAMNGNPTVRFQPQDGLKEMFQFGGFSDHTVIAVVAPAAATGAGNIMGPHDQTTHTIAMSSVPEATYHGATSPSGALTHGKPHILVATADVTTFALDLLVNSRVDVDGVLGTDNAVIASSYAWSTADGMILGNDATNAGGFDGDIAEFIVFKRVLTPQELLEVQTYLAIKYGITLPANSYDVGVTSLYGAAAYPFAIAGVGRQDCQEFAQTVSSSADDPALTVDASGGVLGDDQYVLWGTDALTMTTQAMVSDLGCIGRRLSRTYRWANKGAGGTAGPVRVTFDLNGFGIDLGNLNAVYLLVDSDLEFHEGATSYLGTALGGGLFEFTGVDPADGSHFTVFACPNATCGNGITEGAETCDDGNGSNGDGCTSDCNAEAALLCGALPHDFWSRPRDLASGQAIDWNDVGGPHDLTVQNQMSAPGVATSIGNGVDVVEFLGGTTQALGSGTFDGAFADHTIFVVTRPYTPVSGVRTILSSGGTSPRALSFDGSNLKYGVESAPISIGQSYIITATAQVSGGTEAAVELFVDGISDGPSTENGAPWAWSDGNGLFVGNSEAVDAPLDGAVGEIVIFKRVLSDLERETVQTYLALKFSLTMPVKSYRSPAGVPLYDFVSHPNTITGVGRADCQQLDLETGVSTDGLLTVAATNLDDGQYVVIGADDGEAVTEPSKILGGCGEVRLQRTYRVGTGEVQDIPVRLIFKTDTIAGPEFANGNVHLLVDADGDFTTGAQVVASSSQGAGTHIFDGVALSHGHYFTLVASYPQPTATDTSHTITIPGFTFIPLTGQYSTGDDAKLTSESGPSSLGYYFVDQASDGAFYLVNTGSWTGVDTLPFEACNSFGCCAEATLTITLDINGPPVSLADAFLVNEGASIMMDVLANDTDPQGDAMTPTVTVGPSFGNTTVQPSGQVLYAPNPGYQGQDSFQYEACDPSGACGVPVTVTIEVNGAPFAGIDGGVVQAGTSVIITTGTNDIDPEGDALTWSEIGQPTHGTVAHIGGSQFLYVAQPGYTGSDPFPYQVCDEHGACTIGLVNMMTTNDPNQAPLATADILSSPQGLVITIPVLNNDTDPNAGDMLTVTQLVTSPSPTEGVATFDPAGDVVFSPAPGFVGLVVFSYEVCDDKFPALCATANIEVTLDAASCDDSVCNGSENCITCSGDCGACTCGNGALDPGEECDDGALDKYDGCDENCKYYQVLGDDTQGVFWVRADWIPGPDGPLTFWDAIGTDFDLTPINRVPSLDRATAQLYFNGHPALNAHPSTRDGMRNTGFNPDNHTAFVVDRRWLDDGGVSMMPGLDPAGSYLWSGGSNHSWYYRNNRIYSPSAISNNHPYIHTMHAISAGAGVELATLSLDGDPGPLKTVSHDGSWPGPGITVADWGSTGSGRWNGHVAEVIVYPGRLGASDRAKVHTYLAVKYGITLPANEYVALDGTTLYGNSSFASRIVGIGRQDTQGLNQAATHAYTANWIKLAVDSVGGNNQYALLGSNVASDDWTGSPWLGYDNASTATYHITNDGPGGTIADINLSFLIPPSLGSLASAELYVVYDDNPAFTSPTEVLVDSIDGSRWASWEDTNLPNNSYIRLAVIQPALCSDGVVNGSESDVDCGGNCTPCPDGNDCFDGSDCASNSCSGGNCQPPSCSDGVKNQGEEDIDCGGPCVYCGCIQYMTFEQNTCNNFDEDCDGSVDENYEDGIACTLSYCIGGVAQNIPSNLSCNDFNGCTQDICSTVAGGCLNIPDPSGTPDASQDDGNVCTDLVCIGGTTQNVADNSNVPDDGLFCTTQTCSGGSLQTSINPGYCVIGGQCIANGASAGTAPCGICDTSVSQTVGQTNFLSYSFETGNEGWTFQMYSGGSTGVSWQRNNFRSTDGNWSLYFGERECPWWNPGCSSYNYDEGTRVHGSATSPAFYNRATFFTFDVHQEVEPDPYPYDSLRVEVKPTSSSSWTTVWFNNGSIDPFREVGIDLAPYQNQTIQIRFRFDTQDEYGNDYEGAWVDNLQFQTACCFSQSDCNDGDACTLDYCDGNRACKSINTCSAGCDLKKNILLVMDYSGSMQGGDGTGSSKWESAVSGLNTAMQQFEPLMNTGLMLFPSQTGGNCGVHDVPGSTAPNWSNLHDNNRSPEYWFGASRTQVVGYLNGLTPNGWTPMARGVRRAGDIYNANHPSMGNDRKNVILITDGAESCDSGNAATEVLNLFNPPGPNPPEQIHTYVIGFGNGVDAAVLDAAAQNGGHAKGPSQAYFSASSAGEMADVMAQILGDLTAEQCNGVDDDCNGLVDDGVPSLSCTVTCNGVDYLGVQACVNGVYETNCSVPSIAEVCDGIDNNCDGNIDEGFVLGATCTAGSGACQNTGTMVCNGSGTGTTCSALPSVPTPELCDGVDNDCSGEVDENYPELGNACDGPDSDACTNGVLECRADGLGTVCVETGESQVEVCNDIDDDCDGVVDNGFNLGDDCDGSDNDQCNEGVLVCDLGTGGVKCTDVTATNVEVCNTNDDDCDGEVDEGFDVGAPCDGSDADLCRNGYKVCTPDGLGTECFEILSAFEEYCNGLDDDCDTLIDEPGSIGCIVYYEDADQDGHGIGPGQCLCSPTGVFTSSLDDDCDDTRSDVYPGAVELCDGVDQDCDVTIDEDPQTDTTPWLMDCYSGPAGTAEVGICRTGSRICQGSLGFTGACEGEQTPLVESCDGADNDCDGDTDEENAVGCTVFFQDVDNDTYGAGPARCLCAPQGEWDHKGPDDDCDDSNPTVNPGANEVCDGLDNECDTFIDEDPADSSLKMTQTCYTGPIDTLGVGTCHAGIETCNSAVGTWGSCENEVTPTVNEICDGLDTDCDGVLDPNEPNDELGTQPHPCASDADCFGLNCACYEDTTSSPSSWSCVSD